MKANESIRCRVTECKHHAGQEDYCTLKSIYVGACEACPRTKEGTDCESFDCK